MGYRSLEVEIGGVVYQLRAQGRRVHLLAAMDHATRAVLAQRQVDGAPDEVPAFQPLLAGLDLAGTVVTADALQTHSGAAEFLVVGKQAHYLFTVKANQPTLLARCVRLACHRVPVLDGTRDRGHGHVLSWRLLVHGSLLLLLVSGLLRGHLLVGPRPGRAVPPPPFLLGAWGFAIRAPS